MELDKAFLAVGAVVDLEDVGEQGWVRTTNAGKRDRAEGVTVHLVKEIHHKGFFRCII